ncbi:MAG: hypothetical protein KF910_13300 [Brevundimonas sp.]|uniref:hypothetical protein n=1 Tax=Brevundimonas sp. TaxID=1871086 RepID=UPI0025BCB93F|nr:hypothetical protein [Brevundimonas sp.]MBX3478581.1 hypothetical protein [Brevundimonas sp.]
MGGRRLGALLDATRRLASLQGLTCVAVAIDGRAIFAFAGPHDGLDRMIEALAQSRWLDGPTVIGERQGPPLSGLIRSAVRPGLIPREQRWLRHEIDQAAPRNRLVFALLDWAVLRDIEVGLMGSDGPAPFPGLPSDPPEQRLQ